MSSAPAASAATEPPSAAPILLNARAGVRPTITGVERWAIEVLPRLQAIDPSRYRALAPPPALRSRAAGQVWEQTALPAVAARVGAAAIFSPANLAPLAWPRNVVVIHDAAVLRYPEAYSRAYRMLHARVGLAAARRALRVVTVSEFSKTELVSLVGLASERVVVVPGGVDPRFGPDASGEPVAAKHGLRAPYVLTVGTDDRRKNLRALTAAARRLQELGIELVWAGGSRPHIAQERSIPGLRQLGYVEDADLPGLYAGALAFVLPSHYEGFGLPCLEAMACGTPVVAADRAALPEVCGGAALLVDPDDTAALAGAVERAAGDEPVRAHLRDAGLRRAAGFSWERTAAAMHELLSEFSRGPR